MVKNKLKRMNIRQKIVAIYCFLFLYTPLIKERFMEKYIVPMNNKLR
jgi:hypothetical protein